ncbi:MAG: hypothetical protein ACT4O2_08620 [Beijerinckiaceae bacterium]
MFLIVVLFAARYAWGEFNKSLDEKRSELLEAKADLRDAEFKLLKGRDAMKRLAAWQEKSLPTNRDVALSLYRSWLLARALEAGLAVDDININARTTPSTAFRSIGYDFEARGQISAVAAFLHAFYRGDQLHQITRLDLRSTAGSPELAVSLAVEALMLPGATHSDKLPDGESKRLKLASVEEYKKSLGERSMFTVYTPPRPPGQPPIARPAPPKFDEAKHAYVTGIIQSGPRLQAWIHVRTTNESLRLYEGDTLKVGDLEGEVKAISRRAVVLQTTDGKELRVALGHSLREEAATEPGDS